MPRLDQVLSDLVASQRDLAAAIQESAEATREFASLSNQAAAGGGDGPGAGGGGEGGVPGAPAAEPPASAVFAQRFAAVSVGIEAIRRSPFGQGVGQGIVDAAQGGSFGAGFTGGINRALAATPVLGEAFGLAGGVRVEDATLGRANAVLGGLAARGREISDRDRDLVLNEILGQEERREAANQGTRVRLNEIRNEQAARGEARRITEAGARRGLLGGAGAALGLGEALFK